MNTYKTPARIFGLFFIAAFLAYGTGSALIDSLTSAPDMLASVYANKMLLVIGAILMAVVHTFLNIGLPVVLLPVLKPRNETLYVGYFSAAIVATIILIVGVIFLLLLVPLSDEYMRAGSALTPHFETMALVLKKAGFLSYQIGMAIWGLGGLMFCTILYQFKLTPRFVSSWGLVGYMVFIAGSILEIFGVNLNLLHTAPGGIFEIFLSVWLIAKGFTALPIAAGSAKTEINKGQRSLSAT